MTELHRQKLLAAADDRDQAAARVEEALALNAARRQEAADQGQVDLERFATAEHDLGEQLTHYRRSAANLRREAAGEPFPVRVELVTDGHERARPAAVDTTDAAAEGVDELIATALAAGKSYAEAGQAAGVSKRTVYRRMSDPDFRTRVIGLRLVAATKGLGILTDNLAGAAEQLVYLCHNSKDESVRLRAAVAIASVFQRFWSEFDLAERIGRLETKLGMTSPAA